MNESPVSALSRSQPRRGRRTLRWLAGSFAAALVAACANDPAPADSPPSPAPRKPDASAERPDGSSLGSYLAGRHAYSQRDYSSAAEYLSRALGDDPENPNLLRRTISLLIADGRIAEAIDFSERLTEVDADSRLAQLLLSLDDAREGDFDRALERIGSIRRDGVYAFLLPLVDGWARFGAGSIEDALLGLEPLGEREPYRPFYALHAGFMSDVAGMAAEAETLYREAVATSRGSLRSVAALGRFLERAGRTDDARTIYAEYQRQNPDSIWVEHVMDALSGDTTNRPPMVADAREGLAEALFSAGSALPQQESGDAGLVYARLALYLRSDMEVARILVGEILESLNRPEDAHVAYRAVDANSPFAWTAQLRAAGSLADLDRIDEAVSALRSMVAKRPERSDAATTLGDTLRMHERYAEAVDAYNTAIDRTEEVENRHWSLFYARGVALERTKAWPKAEADFLRALDLQPDQPLVLNYLGYSWVEQGRNLDEAKAMIEKAVSLRPNDGYIVDSLGWALYQMGDYEEAVRQLERAVELMSSDPVINDHLGDAYWQVGRYNEARFQWERALALDPEEELVAKIRRKLVKGLTAEAEPQPAQ